MMENIIAVAAKSGIAKWVVITVVITLNVECLMPTDVQPLPAPGCGVALRSPGKLCSIVQPLTDNNNLCITEHNYSI